LHCERTTYCSFEDLRRSPKVALRSYSGLTAKHAFLSGNVERWLRDVAPKEDERNESRKNIERLTYGILCAVAFAALAAGCSQTAAPEPNVVQRVEGEKPAPPPPSGFLGKDYALLQPGAPGSGQEAMLRYMAPSVQWSNYKQILVLPVTFWADDDSKVPTKDQQILCNYFT
jgi:hypothetical protein